MLRQWLIRGSVMCGICAGLVSIALAQAQQPDLPSDIPEKFAPATGDFDFSKRRSAGLAAHGNGDSRGVAIIFRSHYRNA
jgi:hypothetical protein